MRDEHGAKHTLAATLWCVAVLALLSGAAMTVRSVRLRAELAQRLAHRNREMQVLRRLRREAERNKAVLAHCEAFAGARPVPLSTLSKAALPDEICEVREIDARPLVAGWAARRVEVVFGDIQLEKLRGFLQQAEAQQPPWRLEECHVSASSQTAGKGRATLVFEAVQRE
ncbi:MAG: hypothetical protein JXR37_06175 [Kiritimatiellae bacterium]|nr:hypothetical protein [Kiritimatiellia bacterium]